MSTRKKWSVCIRVEYIYEVQARTEKEAIEVARRRRDAGYPAAFQPEELDEPNADEMGEEAGS